MLIAMNENPNGVENVKLANNAGYLGESLDGMGADAALQMGPAYEGQIAAAGGASEDARKWIDSIARGAATVIPLFKKTPKTPKEKGGGGFNPPPEDNTMTYVAIGGGVLLGGILLYSMFKKKKK